eukprot:3409031-Pleurochrysis_carterae.AAC.1
MQGDASQRAIDLSPVLGFLHNQILFYRQRNPLSSSVPTAVATPRASPYVQFRGASARGNPFLGQQCLANPTAADRLTPCDRQLHETLDKQIAKREKDQSIVSYAMLDFLNAVGVHNDTIM